MKRRIRHLAKAAGVTPESALERLIEAGFRYRSVNDQVRESEVVRAQIELGLPRQRVHPATTAPLDEPPRQPDARTGHHARVHLEEVRTPKPRGPSGTYYLTEEEVLEIHFALVKMFAKEGDPIVPSGPRPDGLLASALMRPQTSLGKHEKYNTIPEKAAALFHSLVTNHPFHNGNKRTALVATLSFLDRNGRRANADIEDDELFDFVLAVSAGTFSTATNVDDVVEEIGAWWRSRTVGQDHSAREMSITDFTDACEAAGARVVERGGKVLVQGVNGRSITIGGSTRKLAGNVVKAYVGKLGLAGSATGTRLDEFQDRLSPELLVSRFMTVLRRLAYL
jgi:death-on-curing family protein